MIVAVPKIFGENLASITDALYAYARKRVQSEDDICDLIQDTLADYIAHAAQLRETASELGYLTGILRNKIFELYRKQSREFAMGSDALDAILESKNSGIAAHTTNDATLQRLTTDEVTRQIFTCVRRLKQPYFQAFVLREIEELSTDEICKMMTVTVTNLNVILHRARRQLQLMLKSEGIENAK